MKNERKNLPLIFFILLGLFLGVFLKLFVFDIVKISGSSMEPALKNNQTVFINKLAYGIVKPFSSSFIIQWKSVQKNDVVIFLVDNSMVVKRCIATQNDALEFLGDSEYSLKVNGIFVPLTQSQFQFLKDFSCVPKGKVLLIGDNYESSIDSRDFGFIPQENIIGKVICK